MIYSIINIMGIPAYFSYIIKSHVHVLLSAITIQQQYGILNHLFMDCNSIVYDVYHELLKTNSDPSFEIIVDGVLHNIQQIIQSISPNKSVYIAFDGVAPMAKMKQQKMRRLRSSIAQKSDVSLAFHTNMITPGTDFMKYLSQRIPEILSKVSTDTVKIMISTSNEPGEGEHKMMEHIRSYPPSQDTAAIYGLDSDLIMLALYHQTYFRKLFVFREAPEFFKARIPIHFQHPNEPYFIDIGAFTQSIDQELAHPSKEISITSKYTSYVFLCFLLGNDFLPHFPTLNLRTNGIRILMDIYYHLPIKYTQLVVWDPIKTVCKVHWNSFSYFLQQLAKIEHELLLQEYDIREKQYRRYFPENTPEEKETSLLHAPIQLRGEELYISPRDIGWQTRYYKTLFHMKQPTREDIQRICYNYLQGMEWVFLYYTLGCPDWKWQYEYDYPPLFTDLYSHLSTDFHSNFTIGSPCTVEEQMKYILPSVADTSSKPVESWAFCKYMWEAHVI
jgi:5'-3' exonuclease